MGELVALAMIAFLFGMGVGTITNDKGIRDDCEQLGKFRSSGKVYECNVDSSEGAAK